MSVTWPVADSLHFVALSHSHSYLEFVPIGWWQCTPPTQLAPLYKVECPLQEQ